MAHLHELIAEADRLLDPDGFTDHCPNGLQVEGRSEVSVIATGVSASAELFDAALAAGAQLVLTHHGLFWEGDDRRVVGIAAARLRRLLCAEISLASYHLPLDAHPTLGNNALIAAGLELIDCEPFAEHRGSLIGVRGRFAGQGLSASELVARVATLTGRAPLSFCYGREPIQTMAIVSGGGAGHLADAIEEGVDAFLTGEPAEPSRALALESGVHFIAAGHHATETFGVRALGEHLASAFGVCHVALEVDNPV